LADEINRATPKTQSALLEAMQERRITVSGIEHELPEPFFVLATQNPIEMEGTYPLPEAQLDRFFFKIRARSGSVEELVAILERTTAGEEPRLERVMSSGELLDYQAMIREVPIATHLLEFAARVVHASHPDVPDCAAVSRQHIRFGSSPRGAQAMVLAAKALALWRGRFNVSLEDLRSVALPALRHRLIENFEAEARGVDPDSIVEGLLDEVAARSGKR